MLDRKLTPLPEPAPPSLLAGEQHRIALALAEAIIPSSFGIPGADERTIVATEELLQILVKDHPAVAQGWSAIHRTLEYAALAQTGSRFSQLDAAAQERLIRGWEQNSLLRIPLHLLAFLFKFAHFDQHSVANQLGAPRLSQVAEPKRWMQQVSQADDPKLDDELECDVVVIGTGAGGAVVGAELAARGHAVLFVEEGKYHHRDAFTQSSVQAFRDHYRNQTFSLGNNMLPVFVGKMVGGSTALNTGTCWRTPEWILQHWCDLLGTDEFTPAAMAPYFDRVETTLGVTAADKKYIGPFADVVARGCDSLGWSHFTVRRNAPDCQGDGFCQFGCPTDARRSTNISYVPQALEAGAMLITGLRADRLLLENGRAVGLEGVAVNGGRRLKVRAQRVVLAGGSIPTPLFLLRQGLANSSGQVGRNLSLHPSSGFLALMPERIEHQKYIPQGYGCDQFIKDGILLMGAGTAKNFMPLMFALSGHRFTEAVSQMDNIAAMGVMVEDHAADGRVWFEAGGQSVVTYTIKQEDCDRMHRGMVATGEIFRAAGARRLYPSLHGWSQIDTDAEWEAFKRAKLRSNNLLLTSYHPLGTCRMGRDPRTSVVNLDHESHDVPGLFIIDGSTVPTPPSVNPQITIMAMATRAAERLSAQLD